MAKLCPRFPNRESIGQGWWFQSKIVEQRITAKDELIRDYLERLHLMPPEGVT